jgi:hypothetical protein
MKATSTIFVLFLCMLCITGMHAQQYPLAPSLTPKVSDDFGKKKEMQLLRIYQEQNKEHVTELEKFTKQYTDQLNKEARTSAYPDTTCIITIPVVFHVFHSQGSNAVTMAQINAAMADLNLNWAGKNADWGNVNSNFASIKTYSKYRWVLAKIDPKGNPTTGVEYYLEQSGGWGNGSGMDDQIANVAWDNYKYFNVYITHDLYQDNTYNNSGVCWYPDVTMSDAGTARMVYNHAYLGQGGTSNNDLMFNREFTHETGHFLNLAHTFDGDVLSCLDDATHGDQVGDTPSTDQAGGTCATGTATISGCGHIVNWENYMDYYAECQKMFTMGQITRTDAALLTPARQSLYQYDNLVATGVLSSTSTNACITKMFSFSKTKLDEAVANDGSIETPPVIIRTVGGFTFAKTAATLIAGTDYTITNVPAGLNVVIATSSDAKSASLSFNGSATSHNASVVNNIVLTFKNTAVTGGNVAAIPNYTKTFSIKFISPYASTCAITTANITADNATNTWQSFRVTGPVIRYYGLWWDGSAFRFENYGKTVMTTTAVGDNLDILNAGVKIGPSSAWRNAYPGTKFQQGYTQPYIYSSTYTAWDGKTGYVGVRLQKGNDFYYGWMKLQVAAGGSSVTLVEYLINNYPNALILAGGTCNTVTTIDEEKPAMDLNVFLAPNPTHGDVSTIKNLSYDYTGGIYTIYSVDGKLIHSGEIQGMEQDLDTRGFKSGLYFVHVLNKEHTKFSNMKLCKTN